MNRHHPPSPSPSRSSRVIAALLVGLVLLLSLSVVSPEVHAWLHEQNGVEATERCAHAHAAMPDPVSEPDGDGSHTCAVTLFAQGVVHHVPVVAAQPCEGILRAVNYRAFERLALAEPRYLHRPPQAPPTV